MKTDILEGLLELDIAAHELAGGRARTTISAALGKRLYEGTATDKQRALCELLDYVEPDHCLKSYARSVDRPRRRRRQATDENQLIEDTYVVLGVR